LFSIKNRKVDSTVAAANYAACKYSVTVRTNEEAVLHMLRGLSQHCESGRYKQLAWGGSTAASWRLNEGRVTFRFSAPADRKLFLREASRLLSAGTWTLEGTNDNDPASRQR
jgi:hypothetical protein